MSLTGCRWHLVDIGGHLPAHYCATHQAWRHRFGCFTPDGDLSCVCGLDRPSRPVAPDLVEATA